MTTKTQLTTNGYQKDVQGHWIEKDPSAQLTYSMDWSDWLTGTDQVVNVLYTVSNTGDAVNDLHIVDSGIQVGYLTFVELSKGVTSETYVVTAKVTTQDGKIDSRRFRIKVKDRYL